MACVGYGVGFIVGEAGAGAVVGGAAVVAAAAPAGDPALVSGVLTGGEG